jgi:hypothetical protein
MIHTAWSAVRYDAPTRKGTARRQAVIKGKRRCWMHDGRSSGASRGNQHALKHSRYTAQAMAERREARQLWRALRDFIDQLNGG